MNSKHHREELCWGISNDRSWPIFINDRGLIWIYPNINYVGKAIVVVKIIDNSWMDDTNFVEKVISFELNLNHIDYPPVCYSVNSMQSESNFNQDDTKVSTASKIN